jgi:hypothetical protein
MTAVDAWRSLRNSNTYCVSANALTVCSGAETTTKDSSPETEVDEVSFASRRCVSVEVG